MTQDKHTTPIIKVTPKTSIDLFFASSVIPGDVEILETTFPSIICVSDLYLFHSSYIHFPPTHL